MLEMRHVRVLPTGSRWCVWTENGQIEWFADRPAATHTAMIWAYDHRPAEAVLEEPGQAPRVLCSFPG